MIKLANESNDVFCKLTMTTFPPFFFVFLGKSRQGRICNDVPKHKHKSALLKENQIFFLNIKIRLFLLTRNVVQII